MNDLAGTDSETLSLRTVHEELGAATGPWEAPWGAADVPDHYGSWEEEAEALQRSGGLLDFSWRPRLELSGEDRARFLNGQMTCDLRDPRPGTGTYGFLTTGKGRIEADATILFLEDRFVLELPPGTLDTVAERLRKYVLFDRVTIRPLRNTFVLLLTGPQAHRWLEAEGELPQEARNHVQGSCLGRNGRIVRQGDLGVEAFAFWLPAEEAGELFLELARPGDSGLRAVGLQALDAVRIEAGVPWWGRDFGPENLAQETGLDDAVNYEKGCYLGQEIVARLHYRGQVSKQLRRLLFDGPEPPAAGTELHFEGRTAGHVTSSTPTVRGGSAVGLGMLQRRAFEAGTELEVAGGRTARVEAAFSDH